MQSPRWVLLRWLVASAFLLIAGQVLADASRDKHLGVGSCASSQCHGSLKGYEDSDIRRNEYRTWSREDPHAAAYATLKTAASRKMAQNLGLKSAHEADICLDCHSDNVPSDMRGPKFQLSDGVGCEACHGGAERWIESHAEKGASHKDNINNGLVETDDPVVRAPICLSCHYGDKQRFATHEIMAAGHPRLSFELDTFTLRQEHYDIDADYKQRKKLPESVQVWATGVAETAMSTATAMTNRLSETNGLFPEVALFDCHACHHPMDEKRLKKTTLTRGLPVGAIRLNDSSFSMLYAIAKVVAPDLSRPLLNSMSAVHNATVRNSKSISGPLDELRSLIQRIRDKVNQHTFSAADKKRLLGTVVQLSVTGELRDYVAAEQAVMAIDLLAYSLNRQDELSKVIDGLYESLADENNFNPAVFSARAKSISTLP